MRYAATATLLTAWTTVSLAQSPAPADTPLTFEVASIRPVAPGPRFAIGPPVNGMVRARAIEVRRLVQYAYGLDLQQHDPVPEGGPAWIDQDLFEVVAKGPPDLTLADARRRVLSLLRERFSLRSHVATRERPIYALVVARRDGALGAGLRRSKGDCSAYSETLTRTGRGALATEVGPGCGLTIGGGAGGGRLQIRGTATIREMLRPMARSPDVDRDPNDVVSIFTALQEQLGLKLESRRELLDVVVIDSVGPLIPN